MLALVVSACSLGDGDGDDRLSREEYVRQADAICADYEERLARLGDPASIADLATVAGRALPIAREGVARLRELRPPEELARRVDQWLERNERNVALVGELREAARSGDVTHVQEVASALADNERAADALAGRIGLEACAEAG